MTAIAASTATARPSTAGAPTDALGAAPIVTRGLTTR